MKWEDMLNDCFFEDDVFKDSRSMDYYARQRILEKTLKKTGKNKWRRMIARHSALTVCAVCLIMFCSLTAAAAAIMNTDFGKYWESGNTALVPVKELNLSQKLGDYEITLKQMAGDSFGVLILVEVTGKDAGSVDWICRRTDWKLENYDGGGGNGGKRVDDGAVSDKNQFIFYFSSISRDIHGKNMRLTLGDIEDAEGNVVQPGSVTFDLTLDYDIIQIEKDVNLEMPAVEEAKLALERLTVSAIGLCLEMSGEVTEEAGKECWENFSYEISFTDGTKITEKDNIGGGAVIPGSDTIDGNVDLNYRFSKIIDPREIVSIKVNGCEVYQ